MMFTLPLLLAFLFATVPQTVPLSVLLDDFSTLAGWKTIVSDGAALKLEAARGTSGMCMTMEFDLTGGAGYVIAEKPFSIDIPADYQFTLTSAGKLRSTTSSSRSSMNTKTFTG